MTLKILALGPLPPPVGGDTVSFQRICESPCWARQGVELRVLNISRGRAIKVGTRYSARDAIFALRCLGRFVRALGDSQLVLLCLNPSFLWSIGPLFILCARTRRRPVAVKLFGGSWGERFLALGALRRLYVRLALKQVQCLLPQTLALRNELSQILAQPPPPNLVLLPNFRPAQSAGDVDARQAFAAGRFVFAGQIKQEKGVFLFLETLRANSDLRADFYGPILPRDRQAFETALAALPNAAYHGILDPTQVVATLARYVALVLPTTHPGEGLPGIIIEAMQAGRPVIATRWKELGEIVREDETGFLCEAPTAEALASALRRARASFTDWERLCAGALRASADYTEARVLGEILVPTLRALARPDN